MAIIFTNEYGLLWWEGEKLLEDGANDPRAVSVRKCGDVVGHIATGNLHVHWLPVSTKTHDSRLTSAKLKLAMCLCTGIYSILMDHVS